MKLKIITLLAAGLSAAVSAPAIGATANNGLALEASIARGARLYENWSLESGQREEILPHPEFRTKSNRVEAADTWRCVECHGWDYQGNHGFGGIRARLNGKASEVIALLKAKPHGFDGMMRAADFVDLANFVTRGQIDPEPLNQTALRLKSGAASFENIFATTCAYCHGMDGGRQRGIRPLGETARQQPAKVLHLVLNGHAGGNMPALRAFGADFAAGMLAYAKTLPPQNLAASITNGGRLYDDWQWSTGNRQALPHPSYPTGRPYSNIPVLTWRCIECHGPDYQGQQGHFATGDHATGIKGIRGMAGGDVEAVMTILRNRTHRYGSILKYRDLLDLANFVTQGQVDMDGFIDPKTGLARGDAGNGGTYYQTMCVACHGKEGKFIAKRLLGKRGRQDPWGSLHSMLNGHPDENMPALREIDPGVVKDLLAYIQSLQTKH